MSHDPQPRVALPGERRDAFTLLFHALAPGEQLRRVDRAMELLKEGTLHPEGLFVLGGAGGLVGVIACTPTPGGGALLWPPVCVPGADRAGREDALVGHASAWLKAQGTVLCQALLAPEESSLAAPLLRNGFRYLTRLWYFQLNLAAANFPSEPLAALQHTTYDKISNDVFHATLLETYEDSRDCPELGDIRTIEQIIAGHKAQGEHDPRDWWLFLEAGKPIGVVLLARWPREQFLEVAYMGVVPSHRGRGLGRRMLAEVLAHERRRGGTCVTLSVDERNAPAWGMYRGLGFEPVDSREAYIAAWR